MKLVYGVKDRPKLGRLIVFAIQQLLAIMAATLVVPVITNNTTGSEMSPAAALLGAGVGTLVYVLFTKAKSPVFLGSSFAFLGSMAAAFAGASTNGARLSRPYPRRGIRRTCLCGHRHYREACRRKMGQ